MKHGSIYRFNLTAIRLACTQRTDSKALNGVTVSSKDYLNYTLQLHWIFLIDYLEMGSEVFEIRQLAYVCLAELSNSFSIHF